MTREWAYSGHTGSGEICPLSRSRKVRHPSICVYLIGVMQVIGNVRHELSTWHNRARMRRCPPSRAKHSKKRYSQDNLAPHLVHLYWRSRLQSKKEQAGSHITVPDDCTRRRPAQRKPECAWMGGTKPSQATGERRTPTPRRVEFGKMQTADDGQVRPVVSPWNRPRRD